MKKIFKSIFIISMVLTASKTYSQTRFGLKAGVNVLSMRNLSISSSKLGFHVGGTAEFKLNDNFSLEPGLFLSKKGGYFSNASVYNYGYYNFEVFTSIYYIEIPLNLLIKADAESFTFVFNAGPYWANALLAQTNLSGYLSRVEIGNNGVSSFDIGLNAGIGLEFDNFTIGTQYGFGCLNNGLGDVNRILSLSLGYKFDE